MYNSDSHIYSTMDMSYLPKLTPTEFNSLRESLEIDIEQLETRVNKVNILMELMNKREELINELLDGYAQVRKYQDINSENPQSKIETLSSSRNDNIKSVMVSNNEATIEKSLSVPPFDGDEDLAQLINTANFDTTEAI